MTMWVTQMTLTASLVGGALGQMIIGPISDARGRRGPLLVGMALYTLTSLLCLVAPSVGLLIVLRFAQGLTAAAGVVIARAIARDLYAHRALARCISLLMMVSFLSPIIAPVIGGQLLSVTSWQRNFGTLPLLGAVIGLVVGFWSGETIPPGARHRGGVSASTAEL